MKLPGKLFRQLQDALVSAFPTRQALAPVVRTELDENLDAIAGADTYIEVVFNLIVWAEARDAVETLVTKARAANQTNAELKRFESQLILWRTENRTEEEGPFVPLTSPPPGTLRSKNALNLVQPEQVLNWSLGMQKAARAVCRIALRDGGATGFLIGPRLVLTVRYVFDFSKTSLESQPVRLNFDYFFGPDGVTPQEGTAYKLADYWLIDEDESLQYLLLLVDGSPGTDLLPETGARRGWLKVADESTLHVGDPLFLLMHERLKPLQVGYATPLIDIKPEYKYLAYVEDDQIGKPGASGAPIFNAKWEVVGMHSLRARGPTESLAQQINDKPFLADLARYLPTVKNATVPGDSFGVGCSVRHVMARPKVKLAVAVSNL
ncbi:MAG: trypsin-like peptidase domain-containing protein [Caldilineaceae bacterium]|nr:trypsin-like peptidase domain-containing protein [Caldilineaceae bacterium]